MASEVLPAPYPLFIWTLSLHAGFPGSWHHLVEAIQFPTAKIPLLLLSNTLHLVHSTSFHNENVGFSLCNVSLCWNLRFVWVMCCARSSRKHREDPVHQGDEAGEHSTLLVTSALLVTPVQQWHIFTTAEVTKQLERLLDGRTQQNTHTMLIRPIFKTN